MIRQFSAGGIVYKGVQDDIAILVCQHSGHHGWVFPKGLIGDHIQKEGKEETAIRETKEETGIDATIVSPLSSVTFTFSWQKETYKKTVYYFLMQYAGGDTTHHDWEMENVEWLPMEKVAERLTYDSDKQVWKEALPMIIEIRDSK
jgi:8-oxo-dGTP diphosphatase